MAPAPCAPRLAGPASLLVVAAVLVALPAEAPAAPAPGDGGLVSVAVGRAGFRDMRVKTQFAAAYHHRAVAWRIRPGTGTMNASTMKAGMNRNKTFLPSAVSTAPTTTTIAPVCQRACTARS